ncbi:hypothetical protein [Actinokineospora globicatena]|nr:hypothetical protein [Actinokineospora globicatena]
MVSASASCLVFATAPGVFAGMAIAGLGVALLLPRAGQPALGDRGL